MSNCTGNVMGAISLVNMLTNDFRNKILNPPGSSRREYTSIFDFLLDLLKPFNMTPLDILFFFLDKVLGIDMTEKSLKTMESIQDIGKIADEYYLNGDGGWLMEIENAIKYAIGSALAAIPTCSANLMIGDRFMDSHKVLGSDIGALEENGGVLVKIKDIDPLNYLKYCPLSRIGKGYYGGCEGITKVSDLYKSSDMNAFLWYCKNKSFKTPQTEVNKTMWDNRLRYERYGMRRNNKEWDGWLSSKKIKYYDRDNEDSKLRMTYISNSASGLKKIEPLLQVKYIDASEPSFLLQIPSQTFYRTFNMFPKRKNKRNEEKKKPESEDPSQDKTPSVEFSFNKTLIEFNTEYLESIQVLSAKSIVTYLFESLLRASAIDTVQMDITEIMPREMIRKIVRKSIENYTIGVDDCYFSFSNDEYNSMLENIELLKLRGRELGDASGKYVNMAEKGKDDAIGNILNPGDENTGTLNEERTEIKRELYEISSNVSGGENGGIGISFSSNWFSDLVDDFVISIISQIITPKVITLLVLNYRMLGYEETITWDLLIKRMLSVIFSVIEKIIERLVLMLLELLMKLLSSGLVSYVLLMSLEMINNYIMLLQHSIALCVPKFKLPNLSSSEGFIPGAEITPEKITPDTKTGC